MAAVSRQKATTVVSEALLLEYSGEAAVENIRELVLRDLDIDAMSPPMRVRAPRARARARESERVQVQCR